MKVIANFDIEKIGDFELLNEDTMCEIRGGGTPKSRDKDIFEFDEG